MGHHFADIFKFIFLNEIAVFQISVKFVPKDQIDNNLALVQIMAWHGTGEKPLSDPMTGLVYWGIYASLCLKTHDFIIRS